MAGVIGTGVGMIPFSRPGARQSCALMGAAAGRLVLADAGMGYDDVQRSDAGYVDAGLAAGQLAINRPDMTGIPIINVNSHCSTGSAALDFARQAIESGTISGSGAHAS